MNTRLLCTLIFVSASMLSCTRQPAALQKAPAPLPPVSFGGIPFAPADEIPIARRNNVYIKENTPGIVRPPEEPFKYITYVGPSN